MLTPLTSLKVVFLASFALSAGDLQAQTCRTLGSLELEELLTNAKFLASDNRAAPARARIGIPQYITDSVVYVTSDSVCTLLRQRITDSLSTLDVKWTGPLPEAAIFRVGINHFMVDFAVREDDFALRSFILGGTLVKAIYMTF